MIKTSDGTEKTMVPGDVLFQVRGICWLAVPDPDVQHALC